MTYEASSLDELERLRHENAKLKKINQVLIKRVELGWGNHSDAYQSFEEAAMLADKVKERTFKLQQTLHRLEESNLQLETARRDAELNRQLSEQDRQRLQDAIESISDALVLFDSERRMVMVNTRCSDFWHKHQIPFEIGRTSFQQITAASLALVDLSSKAQRRVSTGKEPISQTIFRLKDGTWIQMSERSTAEGGLVVVYTDITSIKQSEEIRYETAMAEQTLLLKSTLENMYEGVVLVNASGHIEVWNQPFLRIAGLQEAHIARGVDFVETLIESELSASPLLTQCAASDNAPAEMEVTLLSGEIVLHKCHSVPGGGSLHTFSDITERSRHQQALRASEQRIRLITDAMPAMISYVNKQMCYEFVNREFERCFHRDRRQIVGFHLRDVLGEDSFSNLYLYIQRAMLGQSVKFEVEHAGDNGDQRIFNKTFIPHFDDERKVVGFFALEQDVTEQRRTAKALKHAYDYMEQRVNQRTKKISEINAQLRKEIRDRQLAEVGLLDAKREADRANESKSKFLAATSHDLLQPMNSARLFTSALAEIDLPQEARPLLSSLGYSLENLESLITALVDISKLEAGLIEPVLDHFSPNDLLRNLEAEFTPQAKARQLRFRCRSSSRIVHSDAYLLARILRNLLTNAIRYTHSGSILLGVRHRPRGLEIQVTDTGIGIPDDKLKDIFKEFNRIDAQKKRTDQGLGLGLAIVDKLANVMGHEVKVRSHLGKGSTFSILLPYGDTQVFSANRATPTFVDSYHQHLEGSHILVIDNDTFICHAMSDLLSNWGCRVTTVQTLEELRSHDWLGMGKPDVIVADYHLDGDDTGFDALAILAEQLTPLPPVVMITANYTNELRQQVREQGYTLLNKPVKPHKVKLVLSNLLSRASA